MLLGVGWECTVAHLRRSADNVWESCEDSEQLLRFGPLPDTESGDGVPGLLSKHFYPRSHRTGSMTAQSPALYIENFIKNLQSCVAQGIQYIHGKSEWVLQEKLLHMNGIKLAGYNVLTCADFFAKDCFLCGPVNFCKLRISCLTSTQRLSHTQFLDQ